VKKQNHMKEEEKINGGSDSADRKNLMDTEAPDRKNRH